MNGLQPPTSGVQVRFGKTVRRCPDIESAGLWAVTDSQRELARGPKVGGPALPALPGDALELRQIQEMDDFPEDVQDVVVGTTLRSRRQRSWRHLQNCTEDEGELPSRAVLSRSPTT